MENDYLILVDTNDKAWGKLEKSLVHELGLLHRAFSIFIFNSKGEMLIQQRADSKYHSAGLWTNACCSHPRFGEEITSAVERRLFEEINLSCETEFAFSFVYHAEFSNGLIENEFDHVYIGVSDEIPILDENEAKDWKYISIEDLKIEICNNPENFTVWFKTCLDDVLSFYHSKMSIVYASN